MPKMDSLVEYTLELLEPLGPVQARSMFGGWGFYSSGLMFGVIVDGRFYLKADELTHPLFEAAGCERWSYDSGKGKGATRMPYWTPPTDASDDAHALLPWARRAVEAAQRAAAKKAPRAKKAAAKKKAGAPRSLKRS
ncbi:MAG: TfoX/Sxy family protein [Hyalangium sp.]|uniref:TfoX/Sxy family protein n=1 Tax=Hyalangium sp. TaxID=2028555 RepID=UPI00389ADC9B